MTRNSQNGIRLIRFSGRTALPGLFSILLLCGNVVGQTKPLAKTNDTDSSNPVVEMEPYVVRADHILPKPESWLYLKIPEMTLDREGDGKNRSVTIPGYEILYAGKEKDARDFARELQFRQLTSGALFPMFLPMLPAQGIIIIHNERYRYLHKTTYNPEKDRLWDAPYRDEEINDSNDSNGKNAITKEFILTRHLGTVVMYGKGVTDYWGYAGAAAEAHYFWFFLMIDALTESRIRNASAYPYWLEAGLAHLLLAMRIDSTGVTFANRMYDNAIVTGYKKLPSLADMLPKEEPSVKQRMTSGPLYSEYIIHYGLYGKNGANRENFFALLEAMRYKPFSEELFQKAWGKSSRTVELELSNYIKSDAMKMFAYKFKMPEMPAVVLRAAAQSDIARLKAELYMSRGKMPHALDELRIAYWRGERDPVMLTRLAMLEQRIGSEERARKLVKALMALPAPPPQTHIVAARLRFKEMLAAKPPDEKLNTAESSELIEILSGALAGGLTSEELCGTLAEIVLKSAEPADANTAGFLSEAAKRYPFNKTIAEALKSDDM
jgi:hypothetical protein